MLDIIREAVLINNLQFWGSIFQFAKLRDYLTDAYNFKYQFAYSLNHLEYQIKFANDMTLA
jgi:NAD/NADP transhydrogenase beta subunit